MEETRAFPNRFGGDPLIITPDAGQKRIIADVDAWGRFVKAAKIEPQG